VPSSIHAELHEYMMEMIAGGKFKGTMPEDIALLATSPVSRTNIQTSIDHLGRDRSEVNHMYEVLCNSVHPSVASTLSFITGFDVPRPGLGRIFIGAAGAERSTVTDQVVSSRSETISAISVGLEVVSEALDRSLRSLDDLCLTSRIGQYRIATHWRCIVAPGRNEPCPCRSGRKSKDCRHAWGDRDPHLLQDKSFKQWFEEKDS
jgi:hypothetical protein